jgi:hypothetical protein
MPDRLTDAPSGGAGPVSVKVSVAVAPDGSVAGLIAIELNVSADGDGITVTRATWLEPLNSALTATDVEAETAPAWTAKEALLCPAGIR